MTWIYDENGKNWVEPIPRKKRKTPRALKFAELAHRLLGMSTSAGQRGKRSGFIGHTGVRTALACAALLHLMKPYGEW